MVSADSGSFDVVLVTGMSGAGRSTAAHVLEDIGWFVIDNLPPSMLQQAVELARGSEDISRIAVVVDVRGKSFFRDLNRTLESLGREGIPVRTLFLESSDESLVRRFESYRRPHPLQGSLRITDGLTAERIALGDMRAIADVVIDTTALNVHDLRRKIEAAFGHEDVMALHATVMSFGFKYGIPVDADLVADVRFLPNPHWTAELRPLNGLDEPVSSTVLGQPAAQTFLELYTQLVGVIAPGYVEEGKRYVTIAVGCTGGKHRSVAISEELASRLRTDGIETLVVHRDLGRE